METVLIASNSKFKHNKAKDISNNAFWVKPNKLYHMDEPQAKNCTWVNSFKFKGVTPVQYNGSVLMKDFIKKP